MALQEWDGRGRELAELIEADRDRHLVVISHVEGHQGVQFDAAFIAQEVADWAEVVSVHNGRLTYELKEHLPAGWDVYGTAAKIYPARSLGGPEGIEKKYYMAHRRGELRELTLRLIDDVLSLPAPGEPAFPTGQAATVPRPEMRHGTVETFWGSGERCIVELDEGTRAIVRQHDVLPGVRLDWLLARGQRIRGLFDPESHILDISGSIHQPRLLEAYNWGQVVLGLVTRVDADEALLELLPGVEVSISRGDVSSNPLDDVDALLSPGQVVAARLAQDSGRRKLVLKDVDDDEPVATVPAPVEGGLPWLELGRDLLPPSSEETQDAQVEVALAAADETGFQTTVPGGGKGAVHGAGGGRRGVELGGARREAAGSALRHALLKIDTLESRIHELEEHEAEREHEAEQTATTAGKGVSLEEVRAELEATRRHLQDSSRELAKIRDAKRALAERLNQAQRQARKAARQVPGRDSDAREWFASDEQALRHELYLAWVERVPAGEKDTFAWNPGFTLGAKFASSYFALAPALRRKAAKAVVDLLTGRAERMPAREVHPLRTGMGGDDAQAVREDGASCWRLSVESNVQAARRVHYWKLPDGGIELHEIVPHDVFAP